jgi:hypothetical protein
MFNPSVDSIISDINAKVAKLLQVKAREEERADIARKISVTAALRADLYTAEASRAARLAKKFEDLLS